MVRVILVFSCLACLVLTVFCLNVHAGEEDVLLIDDFETLDQWKSVLFDKRKSASSYSVVHPEDIGSAVQAKSDNSVSVIVYRDSIDLRRYQEIEWRWRVDSVYEKGDGRKKAGHDYPIRLSLFFPIKPESSSFLDRLKYKMMSRIYGGYYPWEGLSYVWANREDQAELLSSPYNKRMKFFPLDRGRASLGKWITHRSNIIEDYRKAFGTEPPSHAMIAIMNDSDNTGESSVSFIDYIRVFSGVALASKQTAKLVVK